MPLDYLIVGQGLAGSLLAWELMERGAKVLVIDNGDSNASRIAAGLINPVTGMRLAKGKDTDRHLQEALKFYQRLEYRFGQSFYIEKPMLRIIRNENELEYCKKRLLDPQYRQYVDRFIEAQYVQNPVSAPMGALLQQQTGFLLTRPLLNSLKEYFIANNSFMEAGFTYREIVNEQNNVTWRNIETKRIVFCEGYRAAENPWFSWLPFQPVKGEILTLTAPNTLLDTILNFGNWLIPINHHTFRIGATFDRENLDTRPTESGRDFLLSSLAKVCPDIKPDTTIAHRANIRPCTLDKNPFVGLHPRNNKFSIFNGFGSKGSLLIPGYAIQLADELENKTSVDEAANLRRFTARYFTD